MCDKLPHMKHGTRTMYVRERCRCGACVQSQRDYDKARLARLTDHGVTGYKLGCRCDDCKRGEREWRVAYTARRIEAGNIPHGTASGYLTYKCRCIDCSAWGKAGQLAKYGLTLKDFHEMHNAQGGACASCGQGFVNSASTHVDHNHETGKVRGILCAGCNLALGLLREDAERIDALAKYIRQFD